VLSQEVPLDEAINFDRCRYIEFYNGIVRFLCHSTAFLYTPANVQNAEITHSTLIFTTVTQYHGDSRKSRHTTKITATATAIVNT